MSSFICSKQTFALIKSGLHDLIISNKDLNRLHTSGIPGFDPYNTHERDMKDNLNKLINKWIEINVRSVYAQYGGADIDQEAEINDLLNPRKSNENITPLDLHNLLGGLSYQIEFEHIEKDNPALTHHYRTLTVIRNRLAHYIVNKLPDSKYTWVK